LLSPDGLRRLDQGTAARVQGDSRPSTSLLVRHPEEGAVAVPCCSTAQWTKLCRKWLAFQPHEQSAPQRFVYALNAGPLMDVQLARLLHRSVSHGQDSLRRWGRVASRTPRAPRALPQPGPELTLRLAPVVG
jgi:hypothetical protein